MQGTASGICNTQGSETAFGMHWKHIITEPRIYNPAKAKPMLQSSLLMFLEFFFTKSE